MKIKTNALIAIILLTLYACKKDASLSVSSGSFTFTNDVSTKSLVLSNDGEKEMDWNIANIPEWLSLSTTGGTIYSESEQVVSLNANIHFTRGNYNSTFLISSNGGDKNIIVDFNLNYTVSVFPGIGVDSLELNNTYGSIITKLGESDFYDSVHYVDSDLKLHIYGYDNTGIILYIWNIYDDVIDEDIVEMFGVTYPFTGVTENNIGIDTPSEIVNQYFGVPESTFLGQYLYYYYDSKGIDFLIEQDLVGLIWIYNPILKKHLLKSNEQQRILNKLLKFK